MPLREPAGAENLREKILLVAPGKAGKTSSWLSIAYWAWVTGDTRKFYVIDTEQAVRDVLNEPKYQGILAEDGGNIHLYEVPDWSDYAAASKEAVAKAVQGDWIVIDFITHAWTAVQEGFLMDAAKKTRGEALYEAGVQGLSGWDMFTEDFNWNAINGAYFDFLKPILLRSRAHVFMTAEQGEINTNARKLSDKDADHLKDFGKYKAEGQKKLPYQCRSYLRLQRLARGRVLFTMGDRARKELDGDDMKGDFFQAYLRDVAGWKIEDGD